MMNQEMKNLIDNQSKATERFLQGFLDMSNDFDEWKKKHPDGTAQDWLDIMYPKKNNIKKNEYLLVLQEENEVTA